MSIYPHRYQVNERKKERNQAYNKPNIVVHYVYVYLHGNDGGRNNSTKNMRHSNKTEQEYKSRQKQLVPFPTRRLNHYISPRLLSTLMTDRRWTAVS